MRLHIDLPPVSNNQLLKLHWAKRGRIRRDFHYAVLDALDEPGLIADYTKGKKAVVIHLFLPRRFDPDNAAGGCKPLIDAMKSEGLLPNDSPRWISLTIEQHISKDRHIEVEIRGAK